MTSLFRIFVVETVRWEGEFLISTLDFSMNCHLRWVTCSLESWIFVKYTKLMIYWASLVAQMVKNPLVICGKPGFDPWVWKIPWRRAWQTTLVFLPRESHGQRSLVGYSPWGCKEWRHNWSNLLLQLLLFQFHNWRYWGIERLLNCPQDLMLVRGRARIYAQAQSL